MHEPLELCPLPRSHVEIRNRLEINYSGRVGGQRKSGEKPGGGVSEGRTEGGKEQLPLSSCRKSVCWGVGLVG